MDDAYLTLAGPAEAEIRIQRSRFLALAAPAADEATARAAVTAMQQRYHDCRHVCHAWRLGRATHTIEARQDAGEPAGTAGEPILVAIRQADLVDTVVVVARYFGGIKLGTGGLARAYGDAAQGALTAAPRREVRLGRMAALAFGYAWQRTVGHVLEQCGGHCVGEEYGADVRWRVWLPLATVDAFTTAVCEATAGAVAAAWHDEGPA